MELRPFRSIRFSPRVIRARGLSAVFAPPYDQISPLGLERLYGSAPENIVRITFRRKDEEDPYAGAAKTLADWLADGTLAQAAWSGFRSLPKQGLYEIAATFSSTPEPSR